MLSIVYITRNRKRELRKSILSCEAHVSIKREYVIIDNGSEDNTAEMINELIASGINIRYFLQDNNRGVSGGRNIGLKEAKGEICYFIDDDATIVSEGLCLDKAYEYLMTHSDVAALGNDCYDTERQCKLLGCKDRKYGSNMIRNYVGCSHFVKKSIVENTLLYPDNLMYGAEELYAGFLFYFLKKTIVQYDEVSILHKPSKSTRTSMSERKRNGYINTYVIKKYFLPRRYRIASYILFLIRIFLFEKGNIKLILQDFDIVRKRYDIQYAHQMEINQVKKMINMFGIEKIL